MFGGKCKHEYEEPTPNRYCECKLCGVGKLLEEKDTIKIYIREELSAMFDFKLWAGTSHG